MIYALVTEQSRWANRLRECETSERPGIVTLDPADPATPEHASALPLRAEDHILLDAVLVPSVFGLLHTRCRHGRAADIRVMFDRRASTFEALAERIGYRARPWLREVAWLDPSPGWRDTLPRVLPARVVPVSDGAAWCRDFGPAPVRLDEVPSRFPPKIQVQTTTDCRRRCPTCPKGRLSPSGDRMSGAMLDRVLAECAAGQPESLELYLHAEPLEDERLESIATRFKAACSDSLVTIISHEHQLTKERARTLRTSGLDIVYLSVNVTDRIAPAVLSRRLDRVAALREELTAGGTELSIVSMTNLLGPTTRALLETAVETRGIPFERFQATTRLGDAPFELSESQRVATVRVCERPFSKAYIRFDGSLVLCCEDWRHESLMGTLAEQGLEDIWVGEPYRRVRRALLEGRAASPCDRCDYVRGGQS